MATGTASANPPSSDQIFSAQTPPVSASDQELPASGQLLDRPLDGIAEKYLSKLLKNIGIMLSYANSNGIPLPEDLRQKIDDLVNHPQLLASRDKISFLNH